MLAPSAANLKRERRVHAKQVSEWESVELLEGTSKVTPQAADVTLAGSKCQS